MTTPQNQEKYDAFRAGLAELPTATDEQKKTWKVIFRLKGHDRLWQNGLGELALSDGTYPDHCEDGAYKVDIKKIKDAGELASGQFGFNGSWEFPVIIKGRETTLCSKIEMVVEIARQIGVPICLNVGGYRFYSIGPPTK